MHSIHALPSRADHHDPTMQQLQQHQQSQQIQTHQNPNEAQDRTTLITVLDSLDPSQQIGGDQQQQRVMGLIDPAQQQQAQPHLVQHLVQSTGHQQQQPHLHQLQPSHTSTSMDSTSSQMGVEEQQQVVVVVSQQDHQQPGSATRSQTSNNLLRQRPQIEGIVADGGGPIVQWLLENYEVADGESLPRSTVYNHYLAHCRQLQMASVNAASFGKLIRSVFLGLKTRRLGTRGHSKYHYFGVRAKQHIQQELLQHQEGAGCSREHEHSGHNTDNGSESDSTGNDECGRSLSAGKRFKRSTGHALDAARHRGQVYHHHQQHELSERHSDQQQIELDTNGVYYGSNNGTNGYDNSSGGGSNKNGLNNNSSSGSSNNNTTDHMISSMDQTHCELSDFRNHLGANWATLVDEHWPQREACLLEGLGGELANYVEPFEAKYKSYYKRMVELLSDLKFLEVEQLWQEFWHPTPHEVDRQWTVQTQQVDSNGRTTDPQQQQQNGQQQSTTSVITQQHLDYQHHNQQQVSLTFQHMYQLTSQPIIVDRINQIDYNLYAAIESFLLPDMLSPIPRPLAQNIRLFAKNIGPWIELAVKDYEPRFAADKSKSARAFGYALRRYTSLNHLSTASRAIWEKRASLAQMSMDLSRVDLRDIEHQVSLMSHNTTPINLLNTGLNSDLTSSSANNRNTNPSSSNTNNNNSSVGTNDIANNQGADNNENNFIDHHHHPQHLCAMQPGQLIQNFLHLLEDPYPASSWPDWCRNLVESRVCGLSLEEARNFVLKWNFYISLIMKELTLRSAPSFGSFQLIRLLFDEYIFYLVVTRLAQAQHKTPTQLLSL